MPHIPLSSLISPFLLTCWIVQFVSWLQNRYWRFSEEVSENPWADFSQLSEMCIKLFQGYQLNELKLVYDILALLRQMNSHIIQPLRDICSEWRIRVWVCHLLLISHSSAETKPHLPSPLCKIRAPSEPVKERIFQEATRSRVPKLLKHNMRATYGLFKLQFENRNKIYRDLLCLMHLNSNEYIIMLLNILSVL